MYLDYLWSQYIYFLSLNRWYIAVCFTDEFERLKEKKKLFSSSILSFSFHFFLSFFPFFKLEELKQSSSFSNSSWQPRSFFSSCFAGVWVWSIFTVYYSSYPSIWFIPPIHCYLVFKSSDQGTCSTSCVH